MKTKKKLIGITGASGVLGKNIIYTNKLNFRFDKFTGDITKKNQVFDWVRKSNFEYILHLAAKAPVSFVEKNYLLSLKTNYKGTKYLVDAINFYRKKKIKWFFFSSTAQVYRYSKNKIKETSQYGGISKYGVTKIKAEKYIIKNLRKNIKYCIGRIFSFTDIEQDRSFFIPSISNRIKNSNKLFMTDKLMQKRDFIHIQDLCRAIIFLLKKEYHMIINIGSGKNVNLDFIVRFFSNKFKKKLIYNENMNNGNNMDLFPDTSRLIKLGFKPKYNLEDILKNFLN
jgi:UDP-glucose 4-epimerase